MDLVLKECFQLFQVLLGCIGQHIRVHILEEVPHLPVYAEHNR